MESLARIDTVAYVRFASVYRQFQGISDFVATLEGLDKRNGGRRGKPSLAAIG